MSRGIPLGEAYFTKCYANIDLLCRKLETRPLPSSMLLSSLTP